VVSRYIKLGDSFQKTTEATCNCPMSNFLKLKRDIKNEKLMKNENIGISEAEWTFKREYIELALIF
jgi:hypothetical protein